MNYRKLLQQMIGVVLVILLLVGCGDGTTAIKPAAGTFATNPTEAGVSSSYALVFIVEQDNRDQIAAYMVACIGSGELMPTASGLMGTAIDIKDSKFTIDNQSILLSGQFTDTVTINGTIEAKSPEATQCGIPPSDKWTAKCGVSTGLVTLMIGGKSFSAEPGPCK